MTIAREPVPLEGVGPTARGVPGPSAGEASTYSGVPLADWYVGGGEQASEIPGEYPYTRGRPRRAAGWTHRELSGEGSPTASNQQFHYLIEHGAHGIDVIGDMPTQAYLDADHPMSAASLGTNGVSLCSAKDYRDLYRDLPFDRISVSHSLPSAVTAAGLYLAARDQGFDPANLRGSILQVPLYTEDCAYATHLPAHLRMRLACDSIKFCAENMPRFHGFIEDTYYIADGGMDSITEMALGFVEIKAVVREMRARGIPVDAYAPRIGILVNCRMDFFEEIAKVRATRRIYARLMRETYGATDPRSLAAAVTVHTSGLTLTAQQPINNVVRGAVQALAMVLAGVDALEISTFDEAFRTPGPMSHLVALRTQQIIALETGAQSVRDPLGGSYFVESLTDELEARILSEVERIESHGDPVQLAEDGYFRPYFERAVADYQRRVDEGEIEIVGVTTLTDTGGLTDPLLDLAAEKIQVAKEHIEAVRQFRADREHAPVVAALADLRAAAADPAADLMPPLIHALESNATLGELAGTMRVGYGMPYDFYKLVEPPA